MMPEPSLKILKLVTGESVIAQITAASTDDVFLLEQPMSFRTMTVVDPETKKQQEILVMKRWDEFSKDPIVHMARGVVFSMMEPDEQITRIYHIQRQHSVNLPDAEPTTKKGPPETIGMNINLRLSEEASKALLDMLGVDIPGLNGNPRRSANEDLFDDEDEDFDDEDDFDYETEENAADVPFGEDWRDWSRDPSDYL